MEDKNLYAWLKIVELAQVSDSAHYKAAINAVEQERKAGARLAALVLELTSGGWLKPNAPQREEAERLARTLAGEQGPMRYYQHGETGQLCATLNVLDGEWGAVTKEFYDNAMAWLHRVTSGGTIVLDDAIPSQPSTILIDTSPDGTHLRFECVQECEHGYEMGACPRGCV